MDRERRPLTAEQRLAELCRAHRRVRIRRLEREVAGPLWRRVVSIVPVLFGREGRLEVRRLLAPRDEVVEALRPFAVFALDQAARLALGYGFLHGGDVQAYLAQPGALDVLSRAGQIAENAHPDSVLSRPWGGPPRLLACVVAELPRSRPLPSGHRVVETARLAQELVGALGPRTDLIALLSG